MGATDTAIRSLLEDVPEASRKMVTNHEAFGYFAARYDFELVGVVIPGGSTLAEPSSAELAELVAVMEREDIRVIFAETSRPATLAEAVAAELGDEVEVVELFTESLGPPGSGAEGLSEMLIANAESIAAALE
jgi:zinc/manganese transport system substrate-binding protein